MGSVMFRGALVNTVTYPVDHGREVEKSEPPSCKLPLFLPTNPPTTHTLQLLLYHPFSV